MEIIFATGNKNKLREVRSMLPSHLKVLSLEDIGFEGNIEETESTIEGNSLLKARTIFDIYKKPVLAEDTGLEVSALNNEPGVRSARYAGDTANAEQNMELLLFRMEGIEKRSAQFKTCATFVTEPTSYRCYEGIIRGEITKAKRGSGGFGYDPIFKPAGFSKVFAELSEEEKNFISHRALAINKFVNFISNF
ncbi:MAG: XTP/dITP diphosphohydrolase [Chitinophagales bacterium]|jgi:XTP/dITP diphosphohydrolase